MEDESYKIFLYPLSMAGGHMDHLIAYFKGWS